jgi:hypothetical protein
MWIESHQELRDHPKLRKCALLLGIPRVQLIGHLQCLWWWALDYAPDGVLDGFGDDDLAIAADWEGDPTQFVQALLDCRLGNGAGFLERTADGHILLHDWWDYAGRLIDKRARDAHRKRAERAPGGRAPAPPPGTAGHYPAPDPASASPSPAPPAPPAAVSPVAASVQCMSDGHPQDGAGTVPNLTIPYQPDPTTSAAPAGAASAAPTAAPFDPLEACLVALRQHDPPPNRPATIARLFRERFGDAYPASPGRLGRMAQRLGGDYVALARLLWQCPCPAGDPHRYLERAVQASAARSRGGAAAHVPRSAAERQAIAAVAAGEIRQSSAANAAAEDPPDPRLTAPVGACGLGWGEIWAQVKQGLRLQGGPQLAASLPAWGETGPAVLCRNDAEREWLDRRLRRLVDESVARIAGAAVPIQFCAPGPPGPGSAS